MSRSLKSCVSRPTILTTVVVKYRVLFITDSRGRGLRDYLYANPIHGVATECHYKPGANLEQLAIDAIQSLSNDRYDFCAIIGGICSFTELFQVGNEKRLCYPLESRAQKTRRAIETVRDLKGRFGSKIVIHTIIPASLLKFFFIKNQAVNFYHNIEREQNALLEDLEEVNDIITALNQRSGISTCNLSNRFTSHSLKRERQFPGRITHRLSRFRDAHLTDGVHPNEDFRHKCFRAVCRALKKDLQTIYGLVC